MLKNISVPYFMLYSEVDQNKMYGFAHMKNQVEPGCYKSRSRKLNK